MHNRFDVVITTYNRAESLSILVLQILELELVPQNIIIIDSSPIENKEIQEIDKVIYLKSSHGNQPYQRYLGTKISKEDILIFMDDDMRILDKNVFNIILNQYDTKDIIGVQPNFTNANEFLRDNLPKSKMKIKSKKVFNFIKLLTGYPSPKQGKISYCGIRGPKQKDALKVECFNGGVFSVRKEFIFTDKFNFQLFSIFETRLGMGEDTIIGFEASRSGDIIYIEKSMFLHDDQKNSIYSVDILSYAKRVSYSRLYLSFEYRRLENKSKFIAFVHYNWYMLWRVIGLIINFSLSPRSVKRKKMLRGYIEGWIKALKDSYSLSKQKDDYYWKNESKNDIN